MAQQADGTTPGSKVLHLFTILLYSKEKLSLASLAEKLGCSKQTILRILPSLDQFGGGRIHEDKDGRQSVYWMEKPKKLNLNLSTDGLRELMVCKNFLAHIMPKSCKKEMGITLLRASEYTDEDSFDLALFNNIGSTVTKGRIDYSQFQDQYNALVNAVAKKQVCTITYKKKNTKKTRSIAPVNIVAMNNTVYIRGWLMEADGEAVPKYDEPLTMSLHNILKVEAEKRKWKNLPPIDETGFGILNTEYIKASVKFTDDAIDYINNRIWSKDQTITEVEDGIILTFSTYSRPELISWVLSFGDQAELIEPKDVRNEIIELIDSMKNIYKLGEGK